MPIDGDIMNSRPVNVGENNVAAFVVAGEQVKQLTFRRCDRCHRRPHWRRRENTAPENSIDIVM